jgi:hypothetical protein
LRFFSGLTTAEIARVLKLKQKLLYRRIERHLRVIRESLLRVGVCGDDVDGIIERLPDDFAIAVRDYCVPAPMSDAVEDDGVGA